MNNEQMDIIVIREQCDGKSEKMHVNKLKL